VQLPSAPRAPCKRYLSRDFLIGAFQAKKTRVRTPLDPPSSASTLSNRRQAPSDDLIKFSEGAFLGAPQRS
jgi:hypothetical protein